MCKNVMSLALMVWDLLYFRDLEKKDRLLNQVISELINDGHVRRTALATPGLLIAYQV